MKTISAELWGFLRLSKQLCKQSRSVWYTMIHHHVHYGLTVIGDTFWSCAIRTLFPLWVKELLEWRQNRLHCVLNRQPHDCLLKRLFRRRSKKTSKLRLTGLCEVNSPETGEFPAQRASNAENVSIWWRHHGDLRSLRSRYVLCKQTDRVEHLYTNQRLYAVDTKH